MEYVASTGARKVLGAVAIAALLAMSVGQVRAAVVFSDTFGAGSNVNSGSPSAPTATSTSYEIASTKNDSGANASTMASGLFTIKMVATTSGVTEAQARFGATPTTLTTAGDAIDLRVTFTDNNIGLAGNADVLYLGLYNSGASTPLTNLQNAGLSAATTAPTGGVAGWQGYVSQIAAIAGTAKIITRPVQTGTTNANQDLVANGASGGTYANPSGVILATTTGASPAPLVSGTVYTEEMTITLNGDGTQTIVTSLFAGVDATGTLLYTDTATDAAPTTASYDGLAIGWRYSGVSGASSMAVSSVVVNMTAGSGVVPEPASLGLLATGGLALLARRRKA